MSFHSTRKPKVYIAAAFRCLSVRDDQAKAYGHLQDSDYISFLESIEEVFLQYGFSTCLPHRDEGQWGKTYYAPGPISALCLRHVATSDLIFAVAERGRGVHIELGYAAAFPDKHILMLHHRDEEPSTLAWGIPEVSHGPAVRKLATYSDRESLLNDIRAFLEHDLRIEPTASSVPRTRVGIVDIGSHTLKFKLIDHAAGAYSQVVRQEKKSLGLMEHVTASGDLPTAAQADAVSVVRDWISSSQQRDKVRQFKIVGTAALRQAKNAGEFCRLIQDKTGFDIEILDSEDEARYVYSAVRSTFPDDCRVAVLNLGGGSTQVVVGTGEKVEAIHLLDFGTRHVIDRFPWQAPMTERQYEDLTSYIGSRVKQAIGTVPMPVSALIHTGGELDFLLRCRVRMDLCTLSPVHVSSIAVSDFRSFSDAFRQLSPDEVARRFDLDPAWAVGSVASNVIALSVADALGAPLFIPSNLNIADGLAADAAKHVTVKMN